MDLSSYKHSALEEDGVQNRVRTFTPAERYFAELLDRNLRRRVTKEDGRRKLQAELPALANLGLSSPMLGILLAYALAVPITHLLQFRKYLRYSNLVHDVACGKWYFLMPGQHADVGGLFTYPIEIRVTEDPLHEALYELIRHRWRRLQKKLTGKQKLGAHSLFDGAFKSDIIGRVAKRYFSENGTRCYLRDEECFDLLKQIVLVRSRFEHPGPVFGTLSGRSRAGLNNINLVDVLHIANGVKPEFTTLDGKPWSNPFAFSDHDAQRNTRLKEEIGYVAKGRAERAIREKCTNAKGRFDRRKCFHFFRDNQVIPGFAYFRDVLAFLGCEARTATVLAGHLLRMYRGDGLLRESRPLPLLHPDDFQILQKELEQLLQQRLVELNSVVTPSERKKAARLLIDAMHCTLLCCGGFRCMEGENLTIITPSPSSDEVWCFVAKGKTGNARRVIELSSLVGNTSLLHAFVEAWRAARTLLQTSGDDENKSVGSIVGKLSDWRGEFRQIRPNSITRSISRLITRIMGRGLQSHLPRRQTIFSMVQRALGTKLVQGNFQSAICHLAASVGQGSLTVAQHSYLGTSAAALDVPLPRLDEAMVTQLVPDAIADALGAARRGLIFSTFRAAENTLKNELSGRVRYGLALKRQHRELLRLIQESPALADRGESCLHLVKPKDDEMYHAARGENALQIIELAFSEPPFVNLWSASILRFFSSISPRGRDILLIMHDSTSEFCDKLADVARLKGMIIIDHRIAGNGVIRESAGR